MCGTTMSGTLHKLIGSVSFAIHDCFRYHEVVVVYTLFYRQLGHILHNISLGYRWVIWQKKKKISSERLTVFN